MDTSPEEITALADQLSQLAKDVASAQDPMTQKHQTAALILQAKQLIRQVQDPYEAIMDHIVNVRFLSSFQGQTPFILVLWLRTTPLTNPHRCTRSQHVLLARSWASSKQFRPLVQPQQRSLLRNAMPLKS